MKTYSVYIGAVGGCTVEVEMPDNASPDDIYDKACKHASLGDCEVADWDGSFEILDEDGEFIADQDTGTLKE